MGLQNVSLIYFKHLITVAAHSLGTLLSNLHRSNKSQFLQCQLQYKGWIQGLDKAVSNWGKPF